MSNNLAFINNLRQKKQYQQPQQQPQQPQPNQLDVLNQNKYNPDVNDNYSKFSESRDKKNYTYTNIVWKPIIGAIDKTIINENDLKINIEKPNHTMIKSKYEQEMNERIKEKEISKQLVEEYAKINNIYKNTIIDEIQKPIDTNLNKSTVDIDNTFIELKNNASNIFKNNNNIDNDALIASISNLDDLMKSIQKL
jgi:hypothetical protein